MKELAIFLLFTTAYASGVKCPVQTGDEIFVGNPADCTTFFQCLGGTPILQHCPGGLHWSTVLNRCEWPSIANCEETESKPPFEPETPTQRPTTEFTGTYPNACPAIDDPLNDVLLKNPQDCHSFFKCLKGKPVLHLCPPGLEWADHLKRCDWPSIAQCKETENKPTVRPTTQRPTTEVTNSYPTGCPIKDNPLTDVLLKNPEDCHSFFKCYKGYPVLMSCPPGQEWADYLKRCDWPSIANCRETGKTTKIPTTKRPSVNKCPAIDDPLYDVFIKNLEDCHSFFKCYKGKPVLIHCPPQQEWAEQLKRCDWPEVAQCTIEY